MVFTPIESSLGGVLIGLSAALAYYGDGKITGISGILGPFLRSVLTCQSFQHGDVWKGLFLLGLVCGGLLNLIFNKDFAFPLALPFSFTRYVIAGFAVGVGTRCGKGCTSGHGICGLPRLSTRSWISVPAFMAVAMLTVTLTRHILRTDSQGPLGIAKLEEHKHWHFPAIAVGASIMLTLLTEILPPRIQGLVTPYICGMIFGLGLGCSGMTDQRKVLDFLDITGTWDPSLAFVMGSGLCVSFPAFFWAEREGSKPRCGEFEKPPKTGDYALLVWGPVFFGIGWGLIGLCPGPAAAGLLPYLSQGSGSYALGSSFIALCFGWLATDKVLVRFTSTGSTTVTKPGSEYQALSLNSGAVVHNANNATEVAKC